MTRADIDVYQDAAGDWRWRLIAGNRKIIADSAEGYDSRSNAERAVETVRSAFASATPAP